MTSRGILVGFAACAAFYGARFQTPTDRQELNFMVALWAESLADISDEDGIAAFKLWGSTQEHPPTPVNIRDTARPAESLSHDLTSEDRRIFCVNCSGEITADDQLEANYEDGAGWSHKVCA